MDAFTPLSHDSIVRELLRYSLEPAFELGHVGSTGLMRAGSLLKHKPFASRLEFDGRYNEDGIALGQ